MRDLARLTAGVVLSCVAACSAAPNFPASNDRDTPAPLRGQYVSLSSARRTELQQVNVFVNRTIVEVSDLEQYGREDVWRLPTEGKGDCEDFALLKKKMLTERGWPEKALSIAVGVSWRGEPHAVLSVSTDDGELILDNLTDVILAPEQTGHTLLVRQNGDGWLSSTGAITGRPSVDLPVAQVLVRQPKVRLP